MTQKHDLLIREVVTADESMLLSFFAANNSPSTTRHFTPFALNADTAHHIAVRPHKDHFYIAILRAKIIGLSMLRGWDEGYEIPSFGIVVDTETRGQGVGRLLTQWTLTMAQQLGCRCVRLSVNATNHTGVHLYKSLGFVQQSEQSIVVQGENDTRLVMLKYLVEEEARR